MTAAPRARPIWWWPPTAALAALLGLVTGGCHRDIRLLPGDSEGAAGAGMSGSGGDAGAGGGGGAGVGGAAGATVACAGLGNPILLPTAGGPTCAAALEQRGHLYALCACDTLSLAARLRTDSFDSSTSSGDDGVSAAVGSNGSLQTMTGAELRAGGAIYVAGNGGVRASEHLQAGASFRSNGPLAMLSSNADLLADAYVVGDVSGSVRVSGTLHVPTTAAVGSDVEASLARQAVSPIAAPCACDSNSADFVDVAGAIATAMTDNGDSAAGFGPDALSNVSTATQLPLGCGTYYLSSIGASPTGPVTLKVSGHALLAVQGSVTLGGGLTVMLDDPSAELDLLVGGWFTTSGGTVGAPAAPARFRIWIGGTESLVFDNQPTIAAVIHAPGAPATASAGMTLSGSLLVKSLSFGVDSLVHYDRAILSAGVPCGEKPVAAVP